MSVTHQPVLGDLDAYLGEGTHPGSTKSWARTHVYVGPEPRLRAVAPARRASVGRLNDWDGNRNRMYCAASAACGIIRSRRRTGRAI